MRDGVLVWRHIPGFHSPPRRGAGEEVEKEEDAVGVARPGSSKCSVPSSAPGVGRFASLALGRTPKVGTAEQEGSGAIGDEGDAAVARGDHVKAWPSPEQFLKHPLALFALVPKDAALFIAGAVGGAAAKTLTAPVDRIKLLMQTHSARIIGKRASAGISFFEATAFIVREDGVKGFWKGNFPQIIRIIPYSAMQLFSYEVYKKLLKGTDGGLSVLGRLAAGACAGMTSTLVTHPLDVLRLRLAVEPGCRTISQVALSMLREEGIGSFYSGLGASILGIAPYIAINFCIFDLVKKSLPEKYQKRPETSLATALVSATLATLLCYPLDTVRRQMQMKCSPYGNILEAFPGIVERDGILGLYRGFVPNALKSLPNNSIRLTTFDSAKGLIGKSQKELQRIINENRERLVA